MGILNGLRKKAALGAAALTLLGGVLHFAFKAENAAWAEAPKWESMGVPDTSGGLVVDPHLMNLNKLQVFFGCSNPNNKIKAPEFAFSVSDDGKKWTDVKSPFFGYNMPGVRKVSCALAKKTVGIIFQHNIVDQGPNAFEVMYAYSGDSGWSFSKPAVCDSFVSDSVSETAVNIAGVSGRKPALCFGWLAEGFKVKAALFDPTLRADRPRANNLGRYAAGGERIEMGGEENGGFVCVWNDGSGLLSSYIKPLIGTNEEPVKVASGKFGLNFSVSNNGSGRHALLVYDLPRLRKGENARRQVRLWKDGGWQNVEAAPPAKGEAPLGASLSSCQDKDGSLYVASLSKDGQTIYYSALKDGRFSEPEAAMKLKPLIGCTGFSIAVLNDYVYIYASQGPSCQLVRRRI
ncbi:hypothetical protein IJT93_00775 [bacterium]|nr:hypothetical protein [bacterium]